MGTAHRRGPAKAATGAASVPACAVALGRCSPLVRGVVMVVSLERSEEKNGIAQKQGTFSIFAERP
jgi:hypothetical protein